MAAAARTASRYITRRFSTGGKILSEEEKAAENVYIKEIDERALRIPLFGRPKRRKSNPSSLPTSCRRDHLQNQPWVQDKGPGDHFTPISHASCERRGRRLLRRPQKVEQEKLEKLARKGVKPEEQPPAATGTSATGAKPSQPAGSSTAGVSTDKNRNYAVLAGTVAAVAAFGWWYLGTKSKKPEEVQD